jgi:hypothetical protein
MDRPLTIPWLLEVGPIGHGYGYGLWGPQPTAHGFGVRMAEWDAGWGAVVPLTVGERKVVVGSRHPTCTHAPVTSCSGN